MDIKNNFLPVEGSCQLAGIVKDCDELIEALVRTAALGVANVSDEFRNIFGIGESTATIEGANHYVPNIVDEKSSILDALPERVKSIVYNYYSALISLHREQEARVNSLMESIMSGDSVGLTPGLLHAVNPLRVTLDRENTDCSASWGRSNRSSDQGNGFIIRRGDSLGIKKIGDSVQLSDGSCRAGFTVAVGITTAHMNDDVANKRGSADCILQQRPDIFLFPAEMREVLGQDGFCSIKHVYNHAAKKCY